MTKLRMLCPALVLVLYTVSFELGAPVQGSAVEGVVVQTGTGAGVPGATVTLSTGPIDTLSSEALRVAAGVAGVGIPPAQPRPPAVVQQPGQPGQPAPPPAQPAPPPPPVAEEAYLLSLSDAAQARGMSPGSPELVLALRNFREQTAKFTAYTESDGKFSLRDVPPGRYTVRAERDGFFSTGGAVATITVPGTPAPLRLSMIPGAVLAGRIRDEDGEFLANATVQAFTITYQNGFPTLAPSVTTKTNFRGDYRLYWMPAGDYIVAANRDAAMTLGARSFYPGTPELSSSKSISLKTGETIEGVDFTMAEGRLVKVSGEVTSSAPPPSIQSLGLPPNVQLPANFSLPNNAQLLLYSRDPSAPDSSENPSVGTVQLGTANRGTFEFSVPPGAYDLVAVVQGGGSGRVAIDVGSQDLRGVTVSVQPPVRMKGAIKAINNTTVDFTRVRIQVQPDGKIGASGGIAGGLGMAVVLPDGSFVMSVPIEGRYRIGAAGLPPGVYVTDIRQNGTSVYDSGFEIFATSADAEVELASGTGTVTGTVRDATGKPRPNVVVSLIPPAARRQNRSLYRVINSDSSGRFTMANVPPGDYKAFAWQAIPSGSFYSTKFLERYEDKGQPVRVEPSASAELMLIPANQ